VQTAIVDSLDAVSSTAFDQLDPVAGAAGSYQRARQRGVDGRWRSRYLLATDAGQLGALIPLYTPNGRAWPDPAYDPRGWELPTDATESWNPGSCLLVGSYADLRTALPVQARLREPESLRQLLVPIAALAAEQQRCLVFPYLFSGSRQALAQATGGAIQWARLGREAHLPGICQPDWPAGLSGSARYNLRHDQALIAAAGTSVTVESWADVEEQASELIAEHNIGKDRPDHPEFVKLRNRQWDACAGVELSVLSTRSSAVTGFVSILRWRDQLEVHEIGLRGEQGPERLAAYLDLVFHQPIRLARQCRLSNIRLGSTSERTKAGRGAVFETLYGGVLNVDDTRHLAAR